jgi:hypothetical protein
VTGSGSATGNSHRATGTRHRNAGRQRDSTTGAAVSRRHRNEAAPTRRASAAAKSNVATLVARTRTTSEIEGTAFAPRTSGNRHLAALDNDVAGGSAFTRGQRDGTSSTNAARTTHDSDSTTAGAFATSDHDLATFAC